MRSRLMTSALRSERGRVPSLAIFFIVLACTWAAPARAQTPAQVDATVVQVLVQLLADSIPSVRIAAAESLGNRGATSAVPALIAVATDADRRVREAVVTALGSIGDPSAVNALGNALRTDVSRGVAEAAAAALGGIQTPAAAEQLQAALLLPRDDRFRDTLIQALGRTGQPTAVEVLEGFMPIADRRLQDLILHSLVDAGTAPALGAVLRATQSTNTDLRLRAVRALGGPDRPRPTNALRASSGL